MPSNLQGIARKMFKFISVIALAMVVVFMAIFGFHVFGLQDMMEMEENAQLELIRNRFGDAVTDSIEKDLTTVGKWATNRTNDEFLILEQSLLTLKGQVEDVFRHPERYAQISVSPPKKENAGKPSLQLLTSGGYDNIDPETFETVQRLANLEPIMTELATADANVFESYISTPDGVTLIVDSLADRKFDEYGNIKTYDPRERIWYKGAVKKGSMYFSPVIANYFSGIKEMEFSMPVYVDGSLVAVLEGSVKMDGYLNFLEDRNLGETGFHCLISEGGLLVTTDRTVGELKEPDDAESDIRERVNPELKYVINEALHGENGVGLLKVDDKDYYATYCYIPTCKWALLLFVSVDEIREPANSVLREMGNTTEQIVEGHKDSFRISMVIAAFAIFLVVIRVLYMITLRAKRGTEPISKLAGSMRGISGDNVVFEMEDIYKTGDEIQNLAESFESLTVKMRDYLEEIRKKTREKERIRTELSLAARIQSDMLPGSFPAFPDRREFDIYASMKPAKEVGGDFYDFFFAGEDHLAMVMADVSGKGVPAAMFMMMAKFMIQSHVIACRDPHQVLEEVNNLLFVNNLENMFVTVWIGILDVNTGLLVASNAAHEYPFLKKPDGDFEMIEDPHGTMLGVRKNRKHTNYEIQMKPGSKLFVYTDGVPEATDAKGELFGTDRTCVALNSLADSTPEEILEGVESAVRRFVGDAEQFDDLTMLCIEYFGKEH